jgi:hypothetical protein
MYPLLFPAVSNREDFVSTHAVFDDTPLSVPVPPGQPPSQLVNQPINLHGCILANNAMPFTSSSWVVVDGTITTSSSTPLTIPVPPIGNQLQALTLTVGTGLGILQGDPVQIMDATTGTANQMLGYVTQYTAATGTLVCQIGVSFQFEIRGDAGAGLMGYAPYYDFGLPNDQGSILRATLGNGIMIVDIGYFTISIPEAQFRSVLDIPFHSQTNTISRTLMASLTCTDSINTRQLYIGRLPILYGGVTV